MTEQPGTEESEELTLRSHASSTIQIDVTPQKWKEVVNRADHFGMLMSLIAKRLKVLSVMADTTGLVLEFHGTMLMKDEAKEDGVDTLPINALNTISRKMRKRVETLVLEAKPVGNELPQLASGS